MQQNFGASPRRTVLIVDQSEESRQVLRTVLERRGVQIYEANGAEMGLELAQRFHPGVIVLDLEALSAEDDAIRTQFDTETDCSQTALVILGSAKQGYLETPRQSFVRKPYHYGPLIRKIEELLESTNPPRVVAEMAGSL